MFFFRLPQDEVNIFLVRHGESNGNVDETLYYKEANRLISLSDLGHEQAKSVGKFFAHSFNMNNDNTLFFCSSFTRAHQTADDINSFLNLKLRQDDRIVEYNHGLFDGLSKRERYKKYPKETDYFYYNKDKSNSFFTTTPMGESPSQVAIRFHSFWNDIEHYCITPMTKNIIIVAHGITNLIIQKELMNYSVDWYENASDPHNCSVMQFILYKHDFLIKDCGYVYTPDIS